MILRPSLLSAGPETDLRAWQSHPQWMCIPDDNASGFPCHIEVKPPSETLNRATTRCPAYLSRDPLFSDTL